LGVALGARALFSAASQFHIRTASPNTPERLAAALTYASIGQGEVLATPLNMALAAAAIANNGVAIPAHYRLGLVPATGERVLDPAKSRVLASFLRSVVTNGTAAAQLKSHPIPIAGKTGTAEVAGGRSHSWFAGFAPYGGTPRRRIAFAVILENGGYGGAGAAATAGDIVEAMTSLGMLN
jgi:peptidoglycan glycosyltransferase